MAIKIIIGHNISEFKSRFLSYLLLAQNTFGIKVKVKQSRYRPGVAQRVPGS
jgi:hypothetical protein